jgi:hypothetical protein
LLYFSFEAEEAVKFADVQADCSDRGHIADAFGEFVRFNCKGGHGVSVPRNGVSQTCFARELVEVLQRLVYN